MWFCMAKNNKKKFDIVRITGEESAELLASTPFVGYATDMAKMFDEMFKSKGYEQIIEIR